jgi:hypothetical protein
MVPAVAISDQMTLNFGHGRMESDADEIGYGLNMLFDNEWELTKSREWVEAGSDHHDRLQGVG